MAKPKADRVNGSTQAEQIGAEQPAGDGAADGAQPGETGALAATSGTDAMDEPGPEDFERHSGARLIEDHAADLALEIDVHRRIRNRGPVIAARALKGGGKNPVVKIGSRVFTPRKRPEKSGGGIGLAEVGERSEASLD
jgi:hypothetical protein